MGCVAVDGYEGCPMRIVLTLASCQSGQRRQAGRSGYRQAYQNTKALVNPRNDALGTAAALQVTGFEVVSGLDLSKADRERSIRGFLARLREAAVALLFYAGHRLQASNRNYLMPVDAKFKAEADLDFVFIPVSLVRGPMRRARKKTLIFLDACRDDPLARNLARWDLDAKPAAVPLARAARWAGVHHPRMRRRPTCVGLQ